MDYENFKDLTGRTTSDKILRDKAFNIAKNKKKMMDINVNLLQWFYKFFDIKTSATRARSETLAIRDKSASTGAIKNGNMSNNKLAE